MSDYFYAWEKLHFAVESLDAGNNSRAALLNVMISHIHQLMVKPEHVLPPEIVDDFKKMLKPLERVYHFRDGDAFRMSIEALSDDELQSITDELRRFYKTVCGYREPPRA